MSDDSEKRLEALKKRFQPAEPKEQEKVQPVAEVSVLPMAQTLPAAERRSKTGPKTEREDRGRYTIYMGQTEMKAFEATYKKMVHDLYPQDLDKSEYLEACFRFLCEPYQQEQIRKRLSNK